MKNNKGVMTLIHVVIGIAITLLVANLTPPEPLTRYGLTVIGLFVVTNYWFATIGMIWPRTSQFPMMTFGPCRRIFQVNRFREIFIETGIPYIINRPCPIIIPSLRMIFDPITINQFSRFYNLCLSRQKW